MADPRSPRQKFIALVEDLCHAIKVAPPKVQQAESHPLHMLVARVRQFELQNCSDFQQEQGLSVRF
jgi:hypothetical protein